MENFVLAEVEYALNNGYSKRAKRHMKRNLYKETKKLRNDIILEMKNMHNESDIENELSYNDFKYDSEHLCITLAYMIGLVILYLSIYNTHNIKMLN